MCIRDRAKSKPEIPLGSDLLIYFYYLSLLLINKDGIVTFITQNSWLSSDYGKPFQDFLLNNTTIKLIADSIYKYFDEKDAPQINTIITIFKGNKKATTGRIYFNRYFEDLSKINCQYVDVENLTKNNLANVKRYNVLDKILLEYKWGVLFEMDNLLLKLLNKMKIKQAKDNVSIGQGLNISKDNIVKFNLIEGMAISKKAIPFLTNYDGSPFILKKTQNYIFNSTTITENERKFLNSKKIKPVKINSISRKVPDLILPRGVGKHFCTYNNIWAYSDSYVEIYNTANDTIKKNIWIFLNSSIAWFLREIAGRKNLGGGMLKAEATDLKQFPICFDFKSERMINKIYDDLSKRESENSLLEIESNEHKAIDKIVFDFLELNEEERTKIIGKLKKLIAFREQKSQNKKRGNL